MGQGRKHFGLHREQKSGPRGPLLFLQCLWFLLIDFNNFYTATVRNEQHAYLKQNLPSHLNCVAPLPCKVRARAVFQKLTFSTFSTYFS